MDELNLIMFKTYDIRTKAEAMDEKRTNRLMRALARYMLDIAKTKTVVIARDARLSAPAFMEAAIDVFTNSGLDVIADPLQSSTCLFYFTCLQHLDAAGVMITASHNPESYIGIKLVAPGMKPVAMGSGLEAIKKNYEEDAFTPSCSKGRLVLACMRDSYIAYSMQLAGVKRNSLKGLSVCAEFLSGSGGYEVVAALQEAGADICARHFIPDGRFLYGDPNPIVEASIAPVRHMIGNGAFNLGFCFDGDGDRMDVMSSDGNQIAPGFNMAVLVPYILDLYGSARSGTCFSEKAWNPQFYTDVKSIPSALIAIAQRGVGVNIIRNGHSFIKTKLKEHFSDQFLAAVEETAHYYMNYPVDIHDMSKGFIATENTLFFALLTCRAFLEHPKEYEKAMQLQKSFFREREWSLYFENVSDKMQEVLDDVEAAMVQRGAKIIKTMRDGADLDAVLMRFGLPETFDACSKLSYEWWQIVQRISRSEDAITRWEVVASSAEKCKEINDAIREIADTYIASGCAHY